VKFIGQYIQQFIARFRSDVYLEGVTESAQDHIVGIDADGKLYKQDVPVGDITGITAGNALIGGGTSGTVTINHEDTSSQASVDNSGSTFIQDVTLDAYGHVTGLTSVAVPTLNQDTSGTAAGLSSGPYTSTSLSGNSILTGNGSSPIQAESNFLFFANNNTLQIEQDNNTGAGSIFNFIKSRNGSGGAGVANDVISDITFTSFNDASTPGLVQYGKIIAEISDPTDGQEAGKVEIQVAHGTDGGLGAGLEIQGNTDAAGEIDVNIAKGTGSTTTIAGNLTVTGNVSMGRLTATTSGSTLAGHVSVGDEDGSDNFHIARYSSSYPYAHIRCGENNLNKTTGFQVVTKNGSTHQEAFTINGSNRAASFQGSVSTNSQLTVANNINANGNIVGDGNTNLSSINQITCNQVIATSGVISQQSTGLVSSSSIVGTIKDTDIGTAAYARTAGVTELVFFGTVYAGGNLTPGKVYYLTEDASTSGAVSWRIANATNALASAGKLLAIALSTTPSHGMLLRGAVIIESSILANTTPGRSLFLKATDGAMDISPPNSTGNIQRILGNYIVTTALTNHSMIHFNPSQEFITIA